MVRAIWFLFCYDEQVPRTVNPHTGSFFSILRAANDAKARGTRRQAFGATAAGAAAPTPAAAAVVIEKGGKKTQKQRKKAQQQQQSGDKPTNAGGQGGTQQGVPQRGGQPSSDAPASIPPGMTLEEAEADARARAEAHRQAQLQAEALAKAHAEAMERALGPSPKVEEPAPPSTPVQEVSVSLLGFQVLTNLALSRCLLHAPLLYHGSSRLTIVSASGASGSRARPSLPPP